MRLRLIRTLPSKVKLSDSVTFSLAWLHLAIFTFFLIRYHLSPGTNALYWDAASYFRSAIEWLQSPSLAHFKTFSRPIFSWPVLLPLWLFNVPFTSDSLTLIYNIFALSTLFAASVFFLKTYRAPVSLAAIPLVLPLVFQLSTQFLADTLTTSACLLLNATLYLWQKEPNRRSLLRLGITIAWGLTTKPIFLFWLGIQLVILLLLSRRVRTLFPPLLISVLAAVCLLPSRLPEIIAELHYHNEVLGYWRRFDGVYNHLLWFPTILLKGTPVLFLAILGFTATKKRLAAKELLIWSGLPWLLATLYVSLFVVSKDDRHFLFLTILFLLILSAATASRILVPFAALLATLGWNFPHTPFGYVYLLNHKVVTVRTADTTKFSNESRRLNDLTLALLADCGKRDCPTPFSVFSPHSSPGFNASALANFPLTTQTFTPRDPSLSDPFKVKAATLRYGGWGSRGGFPEAFWESNYVVVIPGYTVGHLLGDTEIYNRKIASEFKRSPSWLVDGLALVSQLDSPFGKVAIYHREHPPTLHSVKQIAEWVQRWDPGNPANQTLFSIAGLSPIP